MTHNLNTKPLSACYAFELAIIARNLRVDGMQGSGWRCHAARAELECRAGRGDDKARAALAKL